MPDVTEAIACPQIWEYQIVPSKHCQDVPTTTFEALQKPEEFPPINGAIVSGDRVVLAVDPNVPDVVQIIRGVVRAIGQTDASQLDVLLWDEASVETVESIQAEVGPGSRVVSHRPSDRRELSYLAADQAGEPIYLNRMLVDADFVLPIVAGRPVAEVHDQDLTGVYPALADSRARLRHRDQISAGQVGREQPG